MWGHALLMIMSINFFTEHALTSRYFEYKIIQVHKWTRRQFFILFQKLFTNSNVESSRSAREAFLLSLLISIFFFLSLYALLHVIYNCRFQLHALRQISFKLHKTLLWLLNFNNFKFLVTIFQWDFLNSHSNLIHSLYLILIMSKRVNVAERREYVLFQRSSV